MTSRRRFLGLLAAAAAATAMAAAPAAAAHAATTTTYRMRLSATSATVQAGDTTTTTISFDASRRLYHTRVDLSVTGLPNGVTASFSPPTPQIGHESTLTFTTAASSPPSAAVVTITAITESSDPIGTSTTFDLTINAP